jgi:predicted SpoU family rRNA methylase
MPTYRSRTGSSYYDFYIWDGDMASLHQWVLKARPDIDSRLGTSGTYTELYFGSDSVMIERRQDVGCDVSVRDSVDGWKPDCAIGDALYPSKRCTAFVHMDAATLDARYELVPDPEPEPPEVSL